MTKKIDMSIHDLEKATRPKDEIRIIVNWDENPDPPKPGEVVITWTEDDDKEE